MTAKRSKLPKLGDLERAVLHHLWEVEEADVAGVHRDVGAARGITPNTVGSALERLYKKGLARRRKVSHAFRYAPAIGRDEFAARRVLEVTDGLPSLASAGLLSAFVDLVADTDEGALDELQALIEEKRHGGGDA